MTKKVYIHPLQLSLTELLLLTSVISSGVERANSSLNGYRSTMGEDRFKFNALMLLYVHKDIELNIDAIIERLTAIVENTLGGCF